MKKFLQKRLKNEKGLTLVELLAVIVILGIIAAIAIPSIGGIINNTKIKAAHSDAQMILSAADLYFAENATIAKVTLEELEADDYISDAGHFEGVSNKKTVFVNKDSTGNTFTGTARVTADISVAYTIATSKNIAAAGTKAKTNAEAPTTVVIVRP